MMSFVKYKEQYDDNYSICPYCGYSYQVESEDFNDQERLVTCEECQKKYWLVQEFSVEHITRADCIANGEEHDYKAIRSLTHCKHCIKCGDLIATKKEDI